MSLYYGILKLLGFLDISNQLYFPAGRKITNRQSSNCNKVRSNDDSFEILAT